MLGPRQASAVLAAAVAVSATVAGCRDATSPPTIQVLLSVYQVDGPTFSTDAAGFPLLSCVGTLNAQATGTGQATWQDVRFYLYAGQDRSAPLDSDIAFAGSVRQAWGSSSIKAGEDEGSRWGFIANVPFSVRLIFHYQVANGQADSAQAFFSCGPDSIPGATPPAISSFAPDTSHRLQPGDSLRVALAASSASGLWATVLAISGPCAASRVFADSLRQSMTRTLAIALPAACPLGAKPVLSVSVVDAALQVTNRTATLPALVDATPPIVFPEVVPRGGNWADPSYVFFVGDTLTAIFQASDNTALGALYWEVLPWGTRDSLVTSGTSAVAQVRIPLPPEWVGGLQLRFFARDSSGNLSSVVTTDTSLIHVFVNTTASVPSASFAGSTADVAFDGRRSLLYVLQPDSGRIVELATGTLAVVGAVALPGRPTGFDLTPGGDSIVTAMAGGQLEIVDLTASPPGITAVHLAALDTMPGWAPAAVAATASGVVLVATFPADIGDGRLISVNLATGAQRVRSDAGSAGHTGYARMARSLDGSVVALNSGGWLQRYDAATDAFGSALSMDPNLYPAVDATGDRATIGYDILDPGFQLLTVVQYQLGGGRYPRPALSPDGRTYYLDDAGVGIARSSTSDGSTIDRIPTPVVASLLRPSPDGTALAVVQSGAASPSTVYLIDLGRLTAPMRPSSSAGRPSGPRPAASR